MPRVMVSGYKFKEVYYREHFVESIGKSLDTLENLRNEKVSSRSTPSGVLPQHLFFDE